MKNLFIYSLTAFVFSSVLWIMWSFFTVQSGIVPNWMGSLMYLPHAARVLMVVYFGWRSIPGLYLAELWGPYYLADDAYNFALWIPSAISVLSVSAALFSLKFFGFPLGTTIKSPLNKRNYKHIGLITMISAFFNALLVNVYLSQIHANFEPVEADINQVLRFFVGDMFGVLVVFIFLAMFLKPVLQQSQSKT
jgi:hypothetical protein